MIIDFLSKFEVHSILIISLLLIIKQYAVPIDDMPAVVGVDFEVYGKVQGVFFRKYTQSKATELGLKGWCMNTKQDTVLGYMEGEKSKVELMKDWLRRTGSPQSRIDKAEFRNEKELDETSQTSFTIKNSIAAFFARKRAKFQRLAIKKEKTIRLGISD